MCINNWYVDSYIHIIFRRIINKFKKLPKSDPIGHIWIFESLVLQYLPTATFSERTWGVGKWARDKDRKIWYDHSGFKTKINYGQRTIIVIYHAENSSFRTEII